MSDERTQALEVARSLEQKGQVDPAVRAYLRAGAVAEAARALAAVKRYADAGHLVMDSLGVGPALVGGLDAERKKLAMKAAVCFAQAGDVKRAVELFIALGDPVRAAEAAERAGDPVEAARIRARIEKKSGGGSQSSTEMGGAAARAAALKLEQAGQLEPAMQQYVQAKAFADAARMAYKLKRYADAARLFDDAGMAFEAAASYAEARDQPKCLEAVVRVPRDHPKYRLAAAQAIRLATDLNVLDFKLDQFVGQFVADGPKDDREADAFYALAKLYRTRDFQENAREVLRKLAAAKPGYKDVAALLAQLDSEAKGSRMAYEKIVRDDSAFHGDARARAAPNKGGLDDIFPDLPDLPPVAPPPPPPKAAYQPGPLSGKMTAVQDPNRPPRITGAGETAMASQPHPSTPHPSQPRAATAVGGSSAASISLPGELTIGSTIADRYRVEAKIGQGGMAAVYRAMDLELGEEIAMKLFLQPSDDPQLLARFKQELTLSRGLAHPNIVRLYDIGQHQGCRFLTMELLTGTDLGALIDGKPMDILRGLRYLVQACSALALAHDKGVIHRDIKPANFFITKDDNLKVMDFGIAKRSTSTAAMTQAGFIAGTPAYMSPEQINNFAAVSHRTDIYALGIVAYEMFTGAVPFDHGEMMQLLMMHLTAQPPSPRAKNPEITEELDKIILQLLEKDPAKRIQSCRQLGQMLQRIEIAWGSD